MSVDPVTAVTTIASGVRWWRRVRPVKVLKAWRQARRSLKRERKGLPPLPLDETEEVMDVLPGKKSWIGLVTVLLGVVLNMAGIGQCTPAAIEAATCVPADTLVSMFVSLLDQVFIAIGSAMTLWGLAMKEIRERRLKAQVAAVNTPAPPPGG